MKEYKLSIGGRDFNVEVLSIGRTEASVKVNGKEMKVAIAREASVYKQMSSVPTAMPTASAPKTQTAGEGTILSPLPGVILDIKVREGQAVRRGEKVAVLEAMKMENEILAEKDGTVTKVFVSKGESVLEGAPIVTVE